MISHCKGALKYLNYCFGLVTLSSFAYGFFPKLSGQFALRPEYRLNPQAQTQEAYSGLEQSLILSLEGKVNERTSFYADMDFFNDGTLRAMGSQHDNSSSQFFYPRYTDFNSSITSLYIKHDFNYFVLKGGRIRTPKWGQGLLLDGGLEGPFSTPLSTEGIHLSLDPEKGQSFGLFAGYDILVDNPMESNTSNAKERAQQHRLFAGVYSDSIEKRGKKDFYSDMGFYFAMHNNPNSRSDKTISVKYMDIYFNLLAQKLNLQWNNELIYRTGNIDGSLAPELGGTSTSGGKMDAFALASNLEWTFYTSGSYDGPLNLRTGDLTEQKLLMDFVYLPGAKLSETTDRRLAFKANPNFSKTIILFSGLENLNDGFRIQGIYDPYSMMNVLFFSLGYCYESLNFGSISATASLARLNDQHTTAGKIGRDTNGRDLGIEVDLKYARSLSKDFELKAEAGMLFAGDAFESYQASAQNIFSARTTLTFNL